jgi:hypothetical protein
MDLRLQNLLIFFDEKIKQIDLHNIKKIICLEKKS